MKLLGLTRAAAFGGRTPAAPRVPRREELGARIAAFERQNAEPAAAWIAAGISLALSAGLAVTFEDSLVRWFAAPAFGASATMVLYAGLVLGRLSVQVYQHGLRVSTAQSETALLFSQIMEVRERRLWPSGLVLELVAGNARIAVSSRDPALRRVAAEIVARTMPIITPRCAADFYAGEDLDFGSIKLSRQRIAWTRPSGETDELALADIADYSVEDGCFVVDVHAGHRRRFCAVPLADIANLGTLETLLSRVTTTRAPLENGR